MEQELTTGLGEGQIAEFIEVEAGQIISEPALPTSASFRFEPVDRIDSGKEAAARTDADSGAGDGDRQMRFARSRAADEHDIALLHNEPAAGKLADESFVDQLIEGVDILGERQFGDGELILDGARWLRTSSSASSRIAASGRADVHIDKCGADFELGSGLITSGGSTRVKSPRIRGV